MHSGSEADVQRGLQAILDALAPNRYRCTTRKNSGGSMIGKPVDLEIRFLKGSCKVAVAVEVAASRHTSLQSME